MDYRFPIAVYKPILQLIEDDDSLKRAFCDYLNVDFQEYISQEGLDTYQAFKILAFMRNAGFLKVGVIAGSAIPIGALGTIDYYLSCCRTLGEALVAIIHYFPIFGFLIPTPELSHDKNKNIVFNFIVKPEDNEDDAVNREAFICGFLTIVNRLTQGELWPLSLTIPEKFKHQEVVVLFESIGKMQVTSGETYLLSYPSGCMDIPLPFANARLASTLKSELDETLASIQTSNSVVSKVMRSFNKAENLSLISQSAIASSLHTSESSLKRSLANEGTSFSNMLVSFKKDRALKLVLDSETKIDSIANTLNYADRASFERAFKSWFKFTPMQFRKMTGLIAIDAKKVKSDDIFSLPASSQTCQQVMQLIHQENYSMRQLTETISFDPILTGKLIGIANSAFYGGREVNNLNEAVTKVLGVDMVQNLAVSMMASVELATDQCPEFDLQRYWTQALVSAELAKLFSVCPNLQREKESKYLVLGALMHNIGAYALVYLRPKQTNQFLKLLMGSNAAYEIKQQLKLQQKIFSISTYRVAGLLLSHWGLPQTLCQLVDQQEDANLEKGTTSLSAKVLVGLTDYVRQLLRVPQNNELMEVRLLDLCGLLEKNPEEMQTRINVIIGQLPEIQMVARRITQDIKVKD